mmetsp:Transcript_20258/g.48629  ORF Transcript_20258/g.48629 Transcript_20258/m.48629 type:complete len:106 (-) Transcript_20258:241-558(-)
MPYKNTAASPAAAATLRRPMAIGCRTNGLLSSGSESPSGNGCRRDFWGARRGALRSFDEVDQPLIHWRWNARFLAQLDDVAINVSHLCFAVVLQVRIHGWPCFVS